MAEAFLSTAGVSVEATAERLGFAETASFITAFKRWKGVTPGAWRQGQ
jgi:AraC-like DNA-binding protein